MLDFGTEINRNDEPETQELFDDNGDGGMELKAQISAPQEVDASRGEPSPEEPGKTIPAAAAPRPPVKPPVLPKCDLISASAPLKNRPGLRGNPHFLHRRRKSDDFSEEEKMEVSRILKAARTSAGLSIQDVEHSTQIRAHYLTALEEADYDRLPQSVYVLAYLRKLCELYGIPEDEEERLVRPWRNIPHELPENLPASVQQDSENPNGKLLRNLEIAIFAVGGIIVLGVIVLIIVLVVSFFSEGPVEPAFDNSELLELQPKPELIAPPHPPAGRR